MNGPFYVNAVITAEQLPCPPNHKTIGSVSLPDWLNIINTHTSYRTYNITLYLNK